MVLRLLVAAVLVCASSSVGGAASASAEPLERGAEPVKALFVTGGGTYDNTIFRVVDLLEGVEARRVDSDSEALEIISDFDVLVLFNLSHGPTEAERRTLRRFVEEGGGVVVLHHALASYGDWPWWWREATGGRYVLSDEADLPASRYRQGESILASPVGQHPITAPLGGLPFHLYDETYERLWLSEEITVLLRTGLSTSDGPLLWLGPRDDLRVVVFQPGHSSSAHWNLGFRLVLERAVHWAAGRL